MTHNQTRDSRQESHVHNNLIGPLDRPGLVRTQDPFQSGAVTGGLLPPSRLRLVLALVRRTGAARAAAAAASANKPVALIELRPGQSVVTGAVVRRFELVVVVVVVVVVATRAVERQRVSLFTASRDKNTIKKN